VKSKKKKKRKGIMMNLKCILHGHKWETYMGMAGCSRCGKFVQYMGITGMERKQARYDADKLNFELKIQERKWDEQNETA